MITIDLTTRNSIYNTLGAQAQWIQHRFGKRNYPEIDLNLDIVAKIVSSQNETFNLMSVFGDPCEHPEFLDIIKLIPAGKSIVHTFLNFNNKEIIDTLNTQHSYVVVPLYGIDELNDKIILNSTWLTIQNNLKMLTCGVCVEFYLFEHNYHQLKNIKQISADLGVDLKVIKGSALHPDGFSTIVNDQGEWLYDAYPCDENLTKIKWPELHKTVAGYNSLIQFVKPIKGKSILNNPNVYKVDKSYDYDNTINISVTGHVFPSFELHRIFSNALCTDWNLLFSKILNPITNIIREDLEYHCAALNRISKILNINNNLNNRALDVILADLADRDI